MTPAMRTPAVAVDGKAITPESLSQLAGALFQGGSLKFRLMQKYRPYICPFDVLVPYVPPLCSVLDVGCGGGLFLGLLTGLGRIKKGYGFDSNLRAIEMANTMAITAHQKGYAASLRFEVRDAAADWPDGRFDVVSLLDVMHHVPPPAQRDVLRKAATRVKPGGRLIYKDMCRRPLWRALANRMHDLVLAQDWIHYVEADSVIEWGETAGLQLQIRSTINLLWYGHELLIFERPASNNRG